MKLLTYIDNQDLNRYKNFIRTNLTTARFIEEPFVNADKTSLYLELSVEDCNLLNEFKNHLVKRVIKEISWYKRFKIKLYARFIIFTNGWVSPTDISRKYNDSEKKFFYHYYLLKK